MRAASLTDVALKWVVGITVPTLIFVVGIMFSISSTVDAKASELEVLKVRVKSLEDTVREIRTAADRIQNATQDMRVQQATFQTELKIKLSDLKQDMNTVSLKLSRRR